MKSLIKKFLYIFDRFKHPYCFPEDIGKDIGLQVLYNDLSLQGCIEKLTSFEYRPQNLTRFMPKKEAECCFKSATRKEKFKNTSLFSYYIFDGWLSFQLIFDDQERLRRIYIQHTTLKDYKGKELEIHLKHAVNS